MFWLIPPYPNDDSRYTDAKRWYELYNPKHTDNGDLILDQTRRKYAEQLDTYKQLDDKADSILKFTATLAALLITVLASLKLQPIVYAVPTLLFFLIAMFLALLARNPFRRPSMTPSKYIIDGVSKTNAPREWMAAGLFLVTEELQIISDWKGAIVEWATIMLCVGVFLSVGIIFMVPNQVPVVERPEQAKAVVVCNEHDRLVAGDYYPALPALQESPEHFVQSGSRLTFYTPL